MASSLQLVSFSPVSALSSHSESQSCLMDSEDSSDELVARLKKLDIEHSGQDELPSSTPSSIPSSPSSISQGTPSTASTSPNRSQVSSQASSSSTTPKAVSVVSSPTLTSSVPPTPALSGSFAETRQMPPPLAIPSTHQNFTTPILSPNQYYLVQKDGQLLMTQNIDFPIDSNPTVVTISSPESTYISGSWIPPYSSSHVRLAPLAPQNNSMPMSEYITPYSMETSIHYPSGTYTDQTSKQSIESMSKMPSSSSGAYESTGSTNGKVYDKNNVEIRTSSREVYREMKMFYGPQPQLNRTIIQTPQAPTTSISNNMLVSEMSVYDPSKMVTSPSYTMNYVYYDPNTNVTYSVPTTTMHLTNPIVSSPLPMGVMNNGLISAKGEQAPFPGESVYFSRYRAPRARPGVCLFTFHLPPEITDEELIQLFGTCGRVLSAKVMRDRQTAESKGYGFVNMSTQLEAERAIEKLHGSRWKNKYLKVSFKKKRFHNRS